MNESDNDDIRRKEATKDAEEELDLYNAELSGILSGYLGSRLPADHDSKADALERRKAREKAKQNALEQRLAADAAYKALYDQTFNMIRDVETRIENALGKAIHDMKDIDAGITDMMNRANVLPDGRKVFRDDDGTVYDENNQVVEGDELHAIVWIEGAPTRAEFVDRHKAKAEQQARIDRLRELQVDIGGFRNRMEDTTNPPTPDELKEIQGEITERLVELRQHDNQAVHQAPVSSTSNTLLPPPSS